MDGLMSSLGPERVNQEAKLRLMRGGESKTVSVKVGERE
jgi:S1-C subfamily serine protease